MIETYEDEIVPPHTRKVTRRQNECLSVLRQFLADHGQSPSLDWLGQALGGISKGNVHRLISELAHHGLIRYQRYGRGKIEIVQRPDDQAQQSAA